MTKRQRLNLAAALRRGSLGEIVRTGQRGLPGTTRQGLAFLEDNFTLSVHNMNPRGRTRGMSAKSRRRRKGKAR